MIGRLLRITALGITFTLAACAANTEESETEGATSSELSGCVATTLKGVDVSSHNDTVDWKKVKAGGRTFGIARTSDGLTGGDDQFAANWKNIKAAGMTRGAYQFFRARHGGVEQADVMLKAIADAGGLKAGDLPPVLDLETNDGQSVATVVSRAKAWLKRVEDKIGVKPIVYTGNNMNATTGTNFEGYALWLAHYGVECPRIPSAWSTWTFWQDSESASVGGVGGEVDNDWFQGDAKALAALTLKRSVSLPRATTEATTALPTLAADAGASMGDGIRGKLED